MELTAKASFGDLPSISKKRRQIRPPRIRITAKLGISHPSQNTHHVIPMVTLVKKVLTTLFPRAGQISSQNQPE
jgi:hypothetical protein